MKTTVIIDSSQLDDFVRCPEYWNYRDQCHYVPLEVKEKTVMDMGSFGHFLLDVYYSGKCLGIHSQELYKSVQAFDVPLDKFKLGEEHKNFVRDRVELYMSAYATKEDIIPDWKEVRDISFDSNGIPIDSIRKQPLVEQGFSYELLNTKEYLFVLEGKIDAIGQMRGMRTIIDHKFQERAHNLYERSIQFRNYSLVTDAALVIINYVRLHKEVNSSSTFQRQVVAFNAIQKRQWKEELTEIFVQIAKMKQSNNYEKRRAACPGKFGYQCEFTRICDEVNPEIGKALLNSYYKIKPPEERWKPW